jgi:Zn-dependent protease
MFSFRLGSIPVRVHFSFLLVVAMLGAGSTGRSLLAWVVVVFASVMLHELGHAVVGMTFGLAPQIDLVGLGGLTSWTGGRDELTTPKRVAISLAGPAVGVTIGVALKAWIKLHPGAWTGDAAALADMVYYVNFYWGVLNLLPIVPLDGGNVLRAILTGTMGPRGERAANVVSIGVAGLVAIGVVLTLGVQNSLFNLMLLAMFIAQNVRALGARNDMEREAPLRETLRAGYDALARGDTGAAIRAGHAVLSGSTYTAVRADAVRLLAFAHLTAGAWGPLMDLMESPASRAIPDDEMGKFEQAARELDRPEEAARIKAIRATRMAPQG